jgi:predicted NBD/HSP70 family sugar kinase
MNEPILSPILDPTFAPIVVEYTTYVSEVSTCKDAQRVLIALKRGDHLVSHFETVVYPYHHEQFSRSCLMVERIIKTLLWLKGGYVVYIAGSIEIATFIQETYAISGKQAFDASFMARVYEHPFEVVYCTIDKVPPMHEEGIPLGGHLEGYRIGFDAGGSDRKVSAVVNGRSIYSEEVIWNPKLMSDPNYHYQGILESMKTAASKMPRVDAIGVSAAGIYIDNKVMAASLFQKVSDEDFEKKIKNLFLDIAKELGDIPICVANDGDVTALAGAMSLGKNKILGIAMGTSQAAGYIDAAGNITGWLNELAFVPIDIQEFAPMDPWSGDVGTGVSYFSQDGVIRLAKIQGIPISPIHSPAEQLADIQVLVEEGSIKALQIFETIGTYLGYAIAYYSMFYDIDEVLLLGRVLSGKGGVLIQEHCTKVLDSLNPFLGKTIHITLPNEATRRVGQSIAAASLTKIS